MTLALATLAFLIAAWAGVTSLLVALDDSGHKIVAALKGQSLLARDIVPTRKVTVRFNTAPVRTSCPHPAQVEWRAAA